MGIAYRSAVVAGIYALSAFGGSMYKLNNIDNQISAINGDPLVQKHDSLIGSLGGISIAKSFLDLNDDTNSYRNSLNKLERDMNVELKNALDPNNKVERKLELRKDLSESNGFYTFVLMTGLMSLWFCYDLVKDHYRLKSLGLD